MHTQLTLFTLPARERSYRDWDLDTGDDPDWGPRNDSILRPGPPASESDDRAGDNDIESSGCVTCYRPGGSARGHLHYYRYSYYAGGRICHRHIPGGNVNNPIAQKRADRVREMIRAGRAPEEILEAIADL